jgi:hypothetical protein
VFELWVVEALFLRLAVDGHLFLGRRTAADE